MTKVTVCCHHGRRNLRQKRQTFSHILSINQWFFWLIFLIFLRCVNVNYNIVFLIQTSNCGLVIFSALICNFLRLTSEVVFLLILKCVDGFVRKMMIRTTCILVHRTISEPQISKLLSKDICKKKKKLKKKSLCRGNSNSIISRKAQELCVSCYRFNSLSLVH